MGWTNISGTRIDHKSPLEEDLWEDVVENEVYNHDRACRYGTHATGVRNALARGVATANGNSDGSGNYVGTITVTFSSDAIDGDPNFGAAPDDILLTLREATSGQAWSNFAAINYWVDKDTAPSSTAFVIQFRMLGGTSSTSTYFQCYWEAEGAPSSGE